MNTHTRRIIRNILLALIVLVLGYDAYKLIHVMRILTRSECSLRVSAISLWKGDFTAGYANEFQEKVRLRKTEAGLDLWNTPQGDIWTVHGERILPFLMGEQRSDIYEPAGHQVQSGDIVLDCGANIGVFTRKALSRGARLVVSIEPAPQTANALRRNFDSEIRSGRVIVYQKGVWDKDAEMELGVHEANQGENSVVFSEGATSKIRVPLTTIDAIVADLKLPRVDFIKMDIEGAEKQAILGGKSTIRRFRPRLSISSEHLPDDFIAIPALVREVDPRYVAQPCHCVLQNEHMKAFVLAFHPVA